MSNVETQGSEGPYKPVLGLISLSVSVNALFRL